MEMTYRDGNLTVHRLGGLITRGWRWVYTRGTHADLMRCLNRYFYNSKGDGASRALERCRSTDGDPGTQWTMEISNEAANRACRSRAVR